MLKIEFGMKKHIPLTGIWIAVILMALMVACDPPKKKMVEPMEKPLPELATIDSLMWRQPDSAFAVLKQFAASPQADSLDEFNGQYVQLLISELLYKNYFEQSNREDLLRAVDYFDSLMANTPDVSQREQNVFLDARAHYVNGVGYDENDDVVKTCSEYLKTLELMEGHFEDKALIGKKAQFMANIYNRLGDLFSEQYIMESAIACYERAFAFCTIEPTTSNGISNILYHIGKQYNKMNEPDKASLYFGQALEKMTSTNNLLYRDIVSNKALSDYQLGFGSDSSLDKLKRIVLQADSQKEQLVRFLIIGVIYTDERVYDSALFYLEPVLEGKDNVAYQIQAADYLRIVYDSLGNNEKKDICMHILASYKESEGENKAMVSKLKDMFQTYLNQKQEKEVEITRRESIRKTIGIIIPIVIAVVLAIIIVAQLRSKKLLKEQQEKANKMLGETEQEHEKELRSWQAEAGKTLEETEKRYEEELKRLQAETEQKLEEVKRKHLQWMTETQRRHEEELRMQKDKSEKEIEKTKDRHKEELETERLAFQKKQEALRKNLQKREEQVNILKKALNLQHEEAKQRRLTFLKEPICRYILNKTKGKHVTTRDVAHDLGIALKDEDFEQLGEAVARNYDGFDHMLLIQCSSLKHSDLSLCHLYLLGLSGSEIAALKNVSYSAIKKQNESLQRKLGVKENMEAYVLKVAEGLCGAQNGTQDGTQDDTQRNGFIDDDLDAWIEKQIKDNPKITTEELAEKSHKGVRTIKRHISMMRHIHYVGSGYSGYWEMVE